MSDTSDTQRCGRCGAEFTATSTPLGLCPACLLKLGMSDPAMTPSQEPEADRITAVPPAPPPLAPPPARRLRLPPRSVWIAAGAVVAHTIGKDILWDATGREPDAAVAKEFQSYLDRLPAGWSLDESQIRDWLREHRNQIHRDDDDRGR